MLFQGSKKDKTTEIPKTVKEQELENNLEKVREWSRRNKCWKFFFGGGKKNKKENKFNINILYIEV